MSHPGYVQCARETWEWGVVGCVRALEDGSSVQRMEFIYRGLWGPGWKKFGLGRSSGC
jgi:hypothetical protein